tara:strand:+ start:2420 stop:3070 length:651 start_codon:yes stop_codon:yes gene_type:complete
MSIQTIIDNATYIKFGRTKTAGQTLSRSGRVLTSTRPTSQPFNFEVGMHDALRFSENRDLIEEIDRLDITTEESIDIGTTNTNLSYITAFKGAANASQIGQITVTSASGSSIVLNTSSVSGTPANAFKKGDFIQLGSSYRYPYRVTSDVAWNSSSVTVPIHRPFIAQDSYTVSGKGIVVGSAVTFRVKMLDKPEYRVYPHDLLAFDSAFSLIEIIE